MSEHNALILDQVLSEITALRQEVRSATAKLDRVYSLLEECQGPSGTHRNVRHPSQSLEEANAVERNTIAAELSGNWIELLARRAQELGLDVPDNTLDRLSPTQKSP